MPLAEALWNEHLNFPSDQFIATIAEHFFCLRVDQFDPSFATGDNHRVRGSFQKPAEFSLSDLTLCDVANIALNNFRAAFLVEITDEFNFAPGAAFSFEGQIFVSNKAGPVQLFKGSLAGYFVFEQSDFEQFLADEFLVWITEEFDHERIGIHYLSGGGIDDQHAVPGRFEKA